MLEIEEDPEIKYLEIPKFTRAHYESLTKYLNKIAVENDDENKENSHIGIGSSEHKRMMAIWSEISSCVGILSAYDFRESFNQRILASLKETNPASYKALVAPFNTLPKLVTHKLSKFVAQWRLINGV